MSLRTKRIKRASVTNGDVEKLDHMIDHTIARRKTYKPTKKVSNEKALFEMIDTRIGNMLARSCDLEAKLDAIEKKRPNRKKVNIQAENQYSQVSQTSNRYSSSKHDSSLSVSIPKLISPSKVSLPGPPINMDVDEAPTNDRTLESLISLIQNLATEINEMHEEQNVLKNQIEKLQECMFSNK